MTSLVPSGNDGRRGGYGMSRRALASAVVAIAVLLVALAWPSGHAGAQAGCAPEQGSCSGGAVGAGGRVVFGARVVDVAHLASGERRDVGSLPACSFRSTGPNFNRRVAYDPARIPMWALFYWMDCGERSYLRWYVLTAADPVADGLITEAVQAAFDTITASFPVLALSPSADRVQLTGMRTWLAIDPASFRRVEGSVTAGEVGVRAFLQPVAVSWDLGNGDRRHCLREGVAVLGAGEPPQVVVPRSASPVCSYTYLVTPGTDGAGAAGSYPLSARVVYRARYLVTGPIAPGLYELGDVVGPATTVALAVRELRSVRVRP